MAENLQAAQADPPTAARTKLAETPHEQKAAAATRKAALSQQSQKRLNQRAAGNGVGAEKEPRKVLKMEIPISLDIDPFATDSYMDPQGAMDRMLSAKDGGRSSPSRDVAVGPGVAATPRGGEKDTGALLARVRKAETEVLTLKHQLLETKAELKAAEDRLLKKDAMIKDQELRIDELIESRVPRDDMDEIIAENTRLAQELQDNEALLADCQKLLEEYAAADERPT
ncbi:hypothetical protein LPJ61_001308 [Coemansia biformis]|uniref:Uncharacterized protein n=1 Tax=Coemansia biformis TaxID=1286918 RepID=A0A9W7YH69_9FUNG|nr:hypothetical protein LPJ61_001308 [Coemansia biformis]